MTRRAVHSGYILLEAVTALAVLSISMVTIHSAIRQTASARGQARDYSDARMLLDTVMSRIELQPQLEESGEDGVFDPPHDRFSYSWRVEEVEVPMPPIPDWVTEEERLLMERTLTNYMGRITVVVRWMRGGLDFETKGETLILPEQFWRPPPPEPPPA